MSDGWLHLHLAICVCVCVCVGKGVTVNEASTAMFTLFIECESFLAEKFTAAAEK